MGEGDCLVKIAEDNCAGAGQRCEEGLCVDLEPGPVDPDGDTPGGDDNTPDTQSPAYIIPQPQDDGCSGGGGQGTTPLQWALFGVVGGLCLIRRRRSIV